MRGFSCLAAALALAAAAYGQTNSGDLFQAIRNNDLKRLAAELGSGADVNTRNSHGTTLLMHAAAYGSVEAVTLLLDRGAGVNIRNESDATALIWSANDHAKASMLIARGADVNARTGRGRTPLMVAATCDGCAATVQLLLSKGADPAARDSQGATALHEAAESNDLETMRLLLSKGADVADVDGGGYTPLMAAAAHCNEAAIRLMLAKGADVNAANTFSGKAKFGKIQIIHVTSLMLAAPQCSAGVIQTLLDAGARVKEKDFREMTPLMFAVASEHQDPSVLKLLLAKGSDVNARSNVGETALDWARKFGNPGTITALLAAGAKPGDPFTPPVRRTVPGRTPAQAAERGMGILQRTTTEFFRQSGCVGCHHQPIATMAFAAARGHAIRVDETAGGEHIQMIRARELRREAPLLERIAGGGFTDPPAYALLALSAAGVPPHSEIDAVALFVAGAQHRDGTWLVDGTSRSPMQEGVIGRTVIAARAIQQYAPPARKPEIDARLARTRQWLLEAKATTNDDCAARLLGLRWLDAPPARVQSAGRQLLALQRPDGGWAQTPTLESDAYATGQALWALNQAGMLGANDAAYQRGVKFLLNTQWEDGSWYVRSRAVKLQPYFQGGFPYDHDQWISSAATGYAVMALAPASSPLAELPKRGRGN
ncbi:MAG: ankyrin repeat domain-containing protein [Acidobacteria bacterium]|nr:ankyrin repeat domain-containing protein [Acidobacteriota bacterium]